MKEAIIIIATLLVFAYGYFLMAKLDQIIDKIQKGRSSGA